MIRLLSRSEAFQFNDTLAAYTARVQEEFYHPLLPFRRFTPGSLVDFGDGARKLTQEDCDRHNQEALEEFLEWNEQGPDIPAPNPSGGTVYFDFPKGAIEDYPQTLGEGMLAFTRKLQWDAVLFLPDIPIIPWLEQDNDYAPVQEALQYLRSLRMDDSFNGAVLASGEDLVTFMGHFFWLVRCNAGLPLVNFSGQGGMPLIGSLCKYGNLHLEFLSTEQRMEVSELAAEVGMGELADRCDEAFSEDTRIEGRKLF